MQGAVISSIIRGCYHAQWLARHDHGICKAAQDTLTKDPTFFLQLLRSRVADPETLCRARWSTFHQSVPSCL